MQHYLRCAALTGATVETANPARVDVLLLSLDLQNALTTPSFSERSDTIFPDIIAKYFGRQDRDDGQRALRRSGKTKS